MPLSDAKKKAQRKYNKRARKTFVLTCHTEYDSDIIEYLDSIQGSKNAYFKSLLRKEIERKK